MTEPDAKRDRVLREAFQYRLELVAYARSLLGDYSAADDAVQEAMLVVVKKCNQFTEGTSVLAWCRSIVRLEVLRLQQRRRRERTLAERLLHDAIDSAFDEFQMAGRVEDSESWREALVHCLDQAPAKGRRVLRARFVEELSYEQIAQHVGMTIEAVRKSLFRTKQLVRNCVETNLQGDL